MSSYTRQIAGFAAGLRLTDVPAEVIARAKGIVLDGLGCALFAANVRWTQILLDMVRNLEPAGGSASIWGRRDTASPVNAALVNGTMVQGYELDDANIASMHSCAAILPTAFAAAEYVGADKVSGERLLSAIIAGFEIGPRVGICMNGDQMIVKGWHAPAIFAPFPAAIAAGKVLGLTSDQHCNALGMAGTQASGLMAAQYGSMFKRVQCAKGSQSGLYGALLAAGGFTGIEDVFEQEFGGYCSTFSQGGNQFNLSALADELGKRWETMRISLKRCACLGANQTAISAIEELMLETGLKAEDVADITIGVTEAQVKHAGWSPYVPKGLTTAQFHLGFCVAMQLIEGEVFVDQMVEENIARPDLVDLANRVTVVRSLEREQKGYEYRRGSDVTVRLRNGKTLTKSVDHYPGSPQRPLTSEQMAAKFRRLAGKTLPAATVAAIEKTVWSLESAASVAPLIQLLRAA